MKSYVQVVQSHPFISRKAKGWGAEKIKDEAVQSEGDDCERLNSAASPEL